MFALSDLPPGYLFPALCVGVYAWKRFNTPAAWRSTTTKWQYNLALAGYVLAALTLWLLLTKLIETNPSVIQFITFGADLGEATETIQGLSAPFAAALFLTVLLPNLWVLKDVDRFLQTCFREMGAIPRKARQLSSSLRHAQFTVPSDVRDEMAQRLNDQGLDLGTLLAAEPGSPARNWVRAVGLMTKLEDVVEQTAYVSSEEEGPRRSTFIRHRELEYEQIISAYKRLTAIASVVLRHDGAESDRSLGFEIPNTRMELLQQSFDEDCKALLRDLSHVVSCGILGSHFSLQQAHRRLENWGFVLSAPRPPLLGWNDLAGLSLAIVLYIFALFLFVVRPGDIGFETALVLSFMIGAIMILATLCAILPKRFLTEGEKGDAHGLRFGLYVLSAGLAIVCWFAVHYLRFMLSTGESFQEIFVNFTAIFYPFALIPAMAAFMIALMTDAEPARWNVPRWSLRWVEGLTLAVVMGGVAFIAAEGARELYAEIPVAERTGTGPPLPSVVIMVQVGVGFIIGAIVPHLYRRVSARRSVEHHFRDEDVWYGAGAPAGGAD